MDISARFELTSREHRSAVRNSAPVRGLMIFGVLLTVYGLVTLLLPKPTTWVIFAGLFISVFLELVAVRWGTQKAASLFAEPWTVRVTERTYALTTAASHAEVEWTAYAEAVDRAGFWYLRQVNGLSGFLPKRAFSDDQQVELAAFFAERLPALKKRWYNPATW